MTRLHPSQAGSPRLRDLPTGPAPAPFPQPPAERLCGSAANAAAAPDQTPPTRQCSTAALSPATAAEVLRQHCAGMGLDALGAKFHQPYAQLARVIAAELQRRADAWARDERAGWPEDGD